MCIEIEKRGRERERGQVFGGEREGGCVGEE